MKTNTLLLSVTISFIAVNVYGQVLFNKVIGNEGEDIGYCIRQTADRGYVVAGVTSSANGIGSNVYLLRTDSMGTLQWSRSFGTTLGTDVVKKLVILEDGGYALVGHTNSGQAAGYDVLVIRTDQDGIEIWQQTYGGMDWDFGNDIIVLPNGNLGIAGITFSYGSGFGDGYFIEIAPDGSEVASFTNGTEQDERFSSVTVKDGHLFFCGSVMSEPSNDRNALIVKTTFDGTEVWRRVFGGEGNDHFNHIIATTDGHLLAVGGTQSTIPGTWDYYYVRVNDDGQASFEGNDGGSGDEEAREVAEDEFGNFALIGYTTTHGSGGRSVQLFIISPSGMWVNSPHSHSARDEEGFSVQRTHDGGFIMVGFTYGYNAQQSDVFIIKTDRNGSAGFDSPVERETDEGIVSVQTEVVLETGITVRDGVLTLTVDRPLAISDVALFDLTGKLVASSREANAGASASLEVTSLARGFYTLRAQLTDGRWASRKIAFDR